MVFNMGLGSEVSIFNLTLSTLRLFLDKLTFVSFWLSKIFILLFIITVITFTYYTYLIKCYFEVNIMHVYYMFFIPLSNNTSLNNSEIDEMFIITFIMYIIIL